MLTITLVNEGKTGDGYEYRYDVRVNYKTIASGKVTGHDRADGWEALVQLVVDTELIKWASLLSSPLTNKQL